MIKNQQGVAKENEVNRMKSNSVHNGEINVKENDLDKVESDPTNDKVRKEKSESGTLSKFATMLTDELNLIANSQPPKLSKNEQNQDDEETEMEVLIPTLSTWDGQWQQRWTR